MKFTKIETKTEELFRRRSNVYEFIKEFMDAEIEVARVEWIGEYKNETSCYTSLNDCVKKLHLPVIVKVRNHEVYLINTKVNG